MENIGVYPRRLTRLAHVSSLPVTVSHDNTVGLVTPLYVRRYGTSYNRTQHSDLDNSLDETDRSPYLNNPPPQKNAPQYTTICTLTDHSLYRNNTPAPPQMLHPQHPPLPTQNPLYLSCLGNVQTVLQHSLCFVRQYSPFASRVCSPVQSVRQYSLSDSTVSVYNTS